MASIKEENCGNSHSLTYNVSDKSNKMCRMCLEEITENAQFSIIDDKLETMLLEFVPEINLSLTPNAISCQSCRNKIQEMHDFKQMCLRTDGFVKKNLECINRITLKLEDDVRATIKKEVYDLDIADDQFLIKEERQIMFVEEEFLTKHVGTRKKSEKLDNTSNKIHKCKVCNYSSNLLKNVKRHSLLHTDEKPFKCDVCDFRTRYKQRLQTHLLSHLDEKYFKCDHCNYSTNFKHRLKVHSDIHKSGKRYTCDQCDYSNHNKHNLVIHLRSHKLDKLYKCTQCAYSSNQSKLLKRHFRTHSDEKPFKCDVCNYSTKYKYHLKRHLIIHSEKK